MVTGATAASPRPGAPEEAHEVVAGLDIEPEPESVPLADARDRVLAERIDADIDVPGFDRASMDGYAYTPETHSALTRLTR